MFLCFMNSLCKNGMQLRRIPGNAADEPGGAGCLTAQRPKGRLFSKTPGFRIRFLQKRAPKKPISKVRRVELLRF